ncbi:hypothetical protein GCM10027034_41910 [Ramlibacter solisilvae]|uniref:Histidine kinase n=1 Tax=Ramlibacter tataouinensis TaxID=94132 RepID=A0A127JTN6_9BURK|nr:hypothetical protein [Ramlibacter tataouinensis]AMO23314.1 hypothetical protein UC35_10905 [Ramlibacter tataouinensis]
MQAEPNPPAASAPERRAEAARYALLRRLAFAMRHQMVVHLQPIGMITDVMERRLQSGAPDLEQIHQSMSKVNGHARAAVQSSLDVVSWLAPEGDVRVAVDAGVRETLGLMRSRFNFRGFSIKDEMGAQAREVSRAAMRSVLPASLLALTDRAASPAELVVAAHDAGSGLELTLELRPTEGTPGYAGDTPYRALDWQDVEALARAEGVGLELDGPRVRLRFA